MTIRICPICAAGTFILLGGAPLLETTFEMVDELAHQGCIHQCSTLPSEYMWAPHPEEGSSATGSFVMSVPPMSIMASSTGELPPGQQETGGLPHRLRINRSVYEGTSGTPLPLLASTT